MVTNAFLSFIQLLDQLKTLEGDISFASISRQEVRDEILQRLTELEMRVSGLREILTDLRSRVDERPSVTSPSLTPVPPVRPISSLTSTADAAMSAKLNEIEETIARCRRLCSGFPGRETEGQQLKEIDYRLTAVSFCITDHWWLGSSFTLVYFRVSFLAVAMDTGEDRWGFENPPVARNNNFFSI